ncbi:hypothetical protein K2173_019497 [Erythroxylum novogranatense]|uniref:Subtilisin inhibitor 1 n=1 Tax=Erythroxylum novogranatense TaxID=1862640 RepID=A0AAV8UEY8_9ROSI|nr:hypothetical protein K2173_019497 [Erythroxylum novogranatense]
MAGNNQNTNPLQPLPTGSAPTLPRFYGFPFGSNPGARTTWPDLVGVTVEEADRKIKEDMPGAQIQVVPPNCFVTMDLRNNRVRLYVDSAGKVARAPTIG